MVARLQGGSGPDVARVRYALAKAGLARAQRRLLDDIGQDYDARKRAYVTALREEFDARDALRATDAASRAR